MAGEVTIPTLPCRDLDDSIGFYEALGFDCTFRQRRPNPYAVVARGDIQIHLFGIDQFDPELSYGSVIVAVPDPDALYRAFAEGLRARYGKLPSAGIPRILRPRKKSGTVGGFSVVDPGGNWLRVSKLGDTEDDAPQQETTGLARVIENAARLGDSKGDHHAALQLLDNGMARFPDAAPMDRVRALLYKAELAVRVDDPAVAVGALRRAEEIGVTDDEREMLAADLAHANELVSALRP